MIFRGVYDFLSNMYPCSIVVSIENETLCFTSVESAFQGLKSTDIEVTKRFQYLNGYDSKREGRKIALRSDWNSVKQNIMLKLLLIKFSDEKLMNKLKAITGEIVEDNTWNDTYWGKCNGYGRNELGKLLMLVRDSKESKKEEEEVIKEEKPFKVIVAGGRDFSDYKLLEEKIKFFMQNHKNFEVVCGMAKGADTLGLKYAISNNIKVHSFPANWDKYGKRAGYLRNEEMAKVSDGLIAFWNGRSKGTEHMISLARQYGIKVAVVGYDG